MRQWDQWQGLPYYPISQFYKKHFGHKVYKIPVSVAQTCPNREGLKGMQTCNFCDVWGSAAYPEVRQQDLRSQILQNRDKVSGRTNAQFFLVYFQAYTNSFARTQQLRDQFEVALEFDFVKGLVVGTRPDCISDAVLDMWQEYSEKTFLSVELGVQSLENSHLEWMRRGHSAEKSLWAIERIKSRTNVDLGVHFMFGSPGETEEQVIRWAKTISALPVDNVKLHNIHVLENTPLAEDFSRGDFTPIDRETYARRVSLFLQHLDPGIAVHRLAALASRSHELVAPQWVAKKMENYQYFLDYLRDHQAYQGQLYETPKLDRL